MSEVMRAVRPDELDSFMRFLERCYGHRRGFPERHGPDQFRRDAEAAECWLALELDGRIVSHVGTYPMEAVVGPARVRVGGIGDVATLPSMRGRGYMSRLLEASIRRMRERGYCLSWLSGDRQRYGAFGWETCGIVHRLRLNRRSLQRAGIAAAEVEEVDPTDPGVVRTVTELHRTLPLHVERPRMDLTLQRHDVRVFLGPDGYLLSRNDWGGDLSVQGVVSPTEREAELALGALDWSGGSNAEIELGPDEGARATRLTRVMSHWHASPQGMFRIIDWPGLLESLKPLLARRAEGLPAFVTCVGCCWRDDTEWATVSWDGAELSVDSTRRADAIEVGLALLTALVCGGPHASPSDLGPLGRLLPVPVHIPSLDHV